MMLALDDTSDSDLSSSTAISDVELEELERQSNDMPLLPAFETEDEGSSTDGLAGKFPDNQRRWIIFLHHCSSCDRESCTYGEKCSKGRCLWNHITECQVSDCSYPLCLRCRRLLKHFKNCTGDCEVCGPVKTMLRNS